VFPQKNTKIVDLTLFPYEGLYLSIGIGIKTCYFFSRSG